MEPRCYVVFGRERARQISAIIERATGAPCPCSQGQPCPLLPSMDGSVPAQRDVALA